MDLEQPVTPVPIPPTWRLYDYRSVGIATFFGSTFAGCLLMAMNYRRLGQTTTATLTAIIGLVVTGLILLMASADNTDWMRPLPLVLMLATMYSAKGIQGEAVKRHVESGGRLASRWAAFGIGMACLALMVALVIGVIFVRNSSKSVTIGTKDDIQYAGQATEKEARALGQALKAEGYLTDRGVTVLLSKGADGVVVSFVVQQGIWDDPNSVAGFKQVAGVAAPAVGGLPIRVRLVDASLAVKKEVTVLPEDVEKTLTVGANDEIRYSGKATEQDARAVGQALKADGYLQDRGVTVLVSKDADGVIVSFVVRKGLWDVAKDVANYVVVGRDIAPVVGGLPMRIRLVDSSLDVKREIALR
jgi:hypothetical protein